METWLHLVGSHRVPRPRLPQSLPRTIEEPRDARAAREVRVAQLRHHLQCAAQTIKYHRPASHDTILRCERG